MTRWLNVLVISAFAFLSSFVYALPCNKYTTCTSCVMGNVSCGWCEVAPASCRPGNRYGPTTGTCLGNFGDQVWNHDHSQVVWVTPAPIVTPAITEVYLKRADPLLVNISVKVPFSVFQPLDLMVNLDVSGSMQSSKDNLKNAIPKMLRTMLVARPDIYFGIDAFIDKPITPTRDYSYMDYDYNLVYAVQQNYNGLQRTIQAVTCTHNADCPESSPTAFVLATCAANGWRSNSLKMLVTITDACPKWAGANSGWECGTMQYNNGNCLNECHNSYSDYSQCWFPTMTESEACNWYGSGEDYPDFATFQNSINQLNVYPVFAIGTDLGCYKDQTVVDGCWKGLITQLGYGNFSKLTSDGTGLVQAIQGGLAYLSSTLRMLTKIDKFFYVKKITPPIYTGVKELDTKVFGVLLNSSQAVQNTTITMAVLGWGTADIVVYARYPCFGCDHVASSGKTIDKCGKCGGTNACLDCLYVPYGANQYDRCGICAGDGSLCMDCTGVIWGPSKKDACGVCKGNGLSCLGCDGKAGSGTYYDICGVCNGTNTCLGCDFVPYSGLKFDKCGVCNGTGACGGCDSTYTKTYDQCGICGGNGTTCFDCNRDQWGTVKFDACGICGGNGSACKGCDGKPGFPPAQYDQCGVCSGPNECLGCDGLPYGAKVACGVCGGNASSCVDCNGVTWGNYIIDMCKLCKDPADPTLNSCIDCNGTAWGTLKYDACLVCGGHNACLGCDGAGGVYDSCGICGGDGTTCTQCKMDLCGVCNGTNACAGCDLNNPFTKDYDLCGVCGGSNLCLGCDGVPFSGYVLSLCDICVPTFSDGSNASAADRGLLCLGCDGVPNSGATVDLCDVCGGDNGCLCDGVIGTRDACQVCNGDGSSCAGCDGVPNSNLIYDQCGVCNGNDSCVGGCYNVPWGKGDVLVCGVCNGDPRVKGCDDVCYSGKVLDSCGVCGGNDSCWDCSGKSWHAPAWQLDQCYVCGGDGSSCLGCNGVPFSNQAYDACGVCNGQNLCVGCDGNLYSGWVLDDCGACGPVKLNECFGCDGKPGGKEYDVCGICGGTESCIGCDRQLWSGKVFDQCYVCGGHDECLGCDGVPYSIATYDQCGICNGTGQSCVGCLGILWGNETIDLCGVCQGTNECLGCDHKPNSFAVYDMCGVCKGNNTCAGCDGVAFSGMEKDVCGDCGGTQTDPGKCNQTFKATPLIALGVVVGVTLFLVGLLIAAFFLYKRLRYGGNWYIPNALLTEAAGNVTNPIFEENKENSFVDNPNFEGRHDDNE